MRAHLALAPDPTSVTVARAWVASTLAAWGCDGLLEAVRLVTSELVGNAVRHARTPLAVDLDLDRHELRVGVTDGTPGTVQQVAADLEAPGGRGLLLVDRVSDRWGCERADGGKTVWAVWGRDGAGAIPDGSGSAGRGAARRG